jgi:PLP dependent protein
MTISDNIKKINSVLPAGTRIVAVSKTKSIECILEAYQTGHRIFGENKVQELAQKYETLPKDIQWHMIGHLQTNKVKYIIPFVDCIESVDSLKLLIHINNEAVKKKRIIKFFFQIYIATEEAKFGLECEEVESIVASGALNKLSNVKLAGLMGMATFTNDEKIISSEFSKIKTCFDKLKESYLKNDDNFCELSIGMSSDYLIALKHGSTLVRIGSGIFGFR